MKAPVTLEIRPFDVPRTVFAQAFAMPPQMPKAPASGAVPPQVPWEPLQGMHVPLCELDPRTLDVLCEQFRAEVFSLAGKEQPPEAAPDRITIDLGPIKKALADLMSVLCDDEGCVSLTGRLGDDMIIAHALDSLQAFIDANR